MIAPALVPQAPHAAAQDVSIACSPPRSDPIVALTWQETGGEVSPCGTQVLVAAARDADADGDDFVTLVEYWDALQLLAVLLRGQGDPQLLSDLGSGHAPVGVDIDDLGRHVLFTADARSSKPALSKHSDQAVADLEGIGLASDRLAGEHPYATAAAIADRLSPTRVLLIRGEADGSDAGWPDAVSAAAMTGAASLLVDPNGLAGTPTRPWLSARADVTEVRLAGGTDVMPQVVGLQALQALAAASPR
ncbi:MAG TPA: cell wall-binding repeat-containing protein [Euzebya sp.]|nr:cell wall-binding repeat-containing protein [Euzebya sp.]